MKKERIVVLCLCVLLSGSLHTQWIAWAWQRALPFPAKAVGPVAAGTQPGTAQNAPRLSAPSNLATAVACAAWPPLGILYSEALIVGKKLKTLPDERQIPGQPLSLALRYANSRK
jgi:hypothetical protein